MIRTLSLGLALAAGLIASPAAAAYAVPVPPRATTALAPSRAAGWTCQGRRCVYVKSQGTWGDCFTAWSPTHGGWLPTRYCH